MLPKRIGGSNVARLKLASDLIEPAHDKLTYLPPFRNNADAETFIRSANLPRYLESNVKKQC